MSDTTIIWEAMAVIITDDHPVVYQYVKGKARSRESAIMKLTGIIAPMFVGGYDVSKIRGVARQFLAYKEKEYKAGNVKIKPIY